MRIAILGAGISGLMAAYSLRHRHDVVVLEAADYVGGHTHTIDVQVSGEKHAIDTGFIVFNHRTYPNFTRLLAELGVDSQPSDMSFSVRCDRTGLEYAGTGWNGLFAQRSNLVNWRFFRLLRDWLRFSREATCILDDQDEELTVADFFARHRYSPEFREQYFLPMGSAVWSCPCGTFEQFPMRLIVKFYQNHGLLTLRDPPQWRVIRGGSRQYVAALLRHLPRRVETGSPVAAVRRLPESIEVHIAGQPPRQFDHVIFACHSDQALRILGNDATPLERRTLAAIPYETNSVVLHTDASVLPRTRRAWASWNYHLPAVTRAGDSGKATLTYNMNRLQGLSSRHTFCVTLNGDEHIASDQILGRFEYHHPVFTTARLAAQRRHAELIDHHRVSYCGAYWGNGFHEDGVNSALAVSAVLNSIDEPHPALAAATAN